MTKRGRPSKYDHDLAMEICTLMESGKSLREICQDDKYPGESTVRKWHIMDVDGFSAHYTRAREVQMDRYLDEIISIADELSSDSAEVNRSRLRVDTRKWVMSKIAPKRFGDKTAVEHSGPGGTPMQLAWTPPESKS